MPDAESVGAVGFAGAFRLLPVDIGWYGIVTVELNADILSLQSIAETAYQYCVLANAYASI